MFLGSVTVKKCLARPTNVLWSHRGSLMFMEVESSAAMFIWGENNNDNNYQVAVSERDTVGMVEASWFDNFPVTWETESETHAE